MILPSPSSSSSSTTAGTAAFPYASAKKICNDVLQLDNSIRLVAIANKMGSLVAYQLRKGLVPLLNEEDLQNNIMKAVLRMKTREDFESKLGDVVYTFALYKKVKRATIPLEHSDLSILTLAFDMAANHESIIMDKILPLIRQEKLLTVADAST